MINLIPNEEKKRKVKDFYFRVLVVFFVMLSFSVFIASVGMLPVYFLSLAEKNFVNAKLEIQKNEPMPIFNQEDVAIVENLNNELNLIEKIKANKYVVSQKIINEIISEKMPDIKITEIAYQDNATKGKTVSLSGVAKSRERLLLFRQALENNSTFKKVDLPISNFVKGSDIKFNLNLIPS